MLFLVFFLSVPFFFHFRNIRPLSSSFLFADSLSAPANLFPTSGPDGHCRVVLETESLQRTGPGRSERESYDESWHFSICNLNLLYSPIWVDRIERLIISMDGNKNQIFSFSGVHIKSTFRLRNSSSLSEYFP